MQTITSGVTFDVKPEGLKTVILTKEFGIHLSPMKYKRPLPEGDEQKDKG